MEVSTCQADFEDNRNTFFSTESVASCDMNDPDKNISMINFRKMIPHTSPLRILKYFQGN